MPFHLDDPSTPRERFGSVMIPLDPFRTAKPSPMATFKEKLIADMVDERCARASLDGTQAEAVKRVVVSAQEELDSKDPIGSAVRLAKIYWAVRRDVGTPPEIRLRTLTCLLDVARRNDLKDLFAESVRLMSARAAPEEARKPKDKDLVEAAARGDEDARKLVKELNPDLFGAMWMAAEKGVNETFWSRLVAHAEYLRREAENDFKNRQGKNPDVVRGLMRRLDEVSENGAPDRGAFAEAAFDEVRRAAQNPRASGVRGPRSGAGAERD